MLKWKVILVSLALALILVSTGSCGFLAGSQPSGLNTVGEAWDFIFNNYVEKDKLDSKALSQAAIRGIMETLNDPHSAYLTPEVYQTQLRSFRGGYQGIGAYVGTREGQTIFVAPIKDSPAEKAGIRPGDKLLKVNDESIEGLTLTEIVLKIQGPVGTQVTIVLIHQGETEPVTLTITRAEIKLRSVFWEMREDIAYIMISTFSTPTPSELLAALKDIPPTAKGIVLDLRNNPGGPLDAAIGVASYFLKEGTVVHTQSHSGEKKAMDVVKTELVTDLPLVVLVNQFSASASEVVAGALQDLGRAKLAGTKTYGKGSINLLQPLSDGSAIYLTTGRWLTPAGHLIEGAGLTPDFPMELEGEKLVEWATDYLKTQKGKTAQRLTIPSSEPGMAMAPAGALSWYPAPEYLLGHKKMPG